jgi:hypothetical protein
MPKMTEGSDDEISGPSLNSLRLARLFAFQADPVAGGRVFCAEYRRHHRHAAGGADGRALVIHATSME